MLCNEQLPSQRTQKSITTITYVNFNYLSNVLTGPLSHSLSKRDYSNR